MAGEIWLSFPFSGNSLELSAPPPLPYLPTPPACDFLFIPSSVLRKPRTVFASCEGPLRAQRRDRHRTLLCLIDYEGLRV